MDLFTLWGLMLDQIRQQNPQYYPMFSKQIFPVSYTESESLLLRPSEPWLSGWITNIYKDTLEGMVQKITGHACVILLQGEDTNIPEQMDSSYPEREDAAKISESSPEENQPVSDIPAPFPETADIIPPDPSKIKPMPAEKVDLPSIRTSSLFKENSEKSVSKNHRDIVNEEYTFENFVPGLCNDFAQSSALAVAKFCTDPAHADFSYNPLFIYGPSGTGKTHLLHAISNYVRSHAPSIKVLFVSSETFTNDLIDSIRNFTMNKFREKYRNQDYLLIDDVQFFGSRDSSKMEIFNTFNDLYSRKKFIIMSSDRTPADIEKLEDRLKSRFSSGIISPISPPDYEFCIALLRKRVASDHIDFPEEVIQYMAENIQTNVREIEGAYNKLTSFSRIRNHPITLDFAIEALKDQISVPSHYALTVDTIIDTVCDYYHVKREQILGKGRPKRIVIPRQMAMYICRTELNESFPSLRDHFKRSDHTTVLYSCDRVQKELENNPKVRADLEAIKRKLKAL